MLRCIKVRDNMIRKKLHASSFGSLLTLRMYLFILQPCKINVHSAYTRLCILPCGVRSSNCWSRVEGRTVSLNMSQWQSNYTKIHAVIWRQKPKYVTKYLDLKTKSWRQQTGASPCRELSTLSCLSWTRWCCRSRNVSSANSKRRRNKKTCYC